MRMRMERRSSRSRGKQELVVRREFIDLSWLLEEEDILVHYHHQQNQYINSKACYADFRPCLIEDA